MITAAKRTRLERYLAGEVVRNSSRRAFIAYGAPIVKSSTYGEAFFHERTRNRAWRMFCFRLLAWWTRFLLQFSGVGRHGV